MTNILTAVTNFLLIGSGVITQELWLAETSQWHGVLSRDVEKPCVEMLEREHLPPGYKLVINKEFVSIITTNPVYRSWTIRYSDGLQYDGRKWESLYREPTLHHVDMGILQNLLTNGVHNE